MTTHKWQFTSRFRRHAFGWRSDHPSSASRKPSRDQAGRPQGARARGRGCHHAAGKALASPGAGGQLIGRPGFGRQQGHRHPGAHHRQGGCRCHSLRQRWLERLWQALQDDEMPYIELLGDYWGELCVTPELASHWADEFMPVLESVWSPKASGHGFSRAPAPAWHPCTPQAATRNCWR
jgi:hypothetical protein